MTGGACVMCQAFTLFERRGNFSGMRSTHVYGGTFGHQGHASAECHVNQDLAQKSRFSAEIKI